MVSNPPFTNHVQESDRNEHDAFEGHEKGNITGMVSDPHFTNLFQEVTAMENLCSLDDFLVAKSPIKRRIATL